MSLYKRGEYYITDFRLRGHRVHRSTWKKSMAEALEVEKQLRNELEIELGPKTPSLIRKRKKEFIVHVDDKCLTEAISMLIKALLGLTSGSRTKEPRMNLDQAALRLYEERWKGQSSGDSSLKRMRDLAKLMGNPELAAIDEKFITKAKRELTESGKTKGTINRYLAHLKTLMRTAKTEWQVIDRVPKFRMEREPSGRVRVITQEEEELILATLRGKPQTGLKNTKRYRHMPDIADLIEVLIDTGMRLGEALKLTYEGNIDLDNRLIHLHALQTKSRKPRSLPMTERVYTILTKRKDGKSSRPFPFWKDRVEHAWQYLRRATGIQDKEFVLHACRHTCASRLIRRGVDLYTVSKLLGHSNITVTERYAHLAVSDLEKAVRKLDK